MKWFRQYAEFATDPKVQMLPEAYQRRLVMLFCFKCDGSVTSQDCEIAFQLRISDTEWLETKKVFVERGFIDENSEILNWDKRQYKSDSSAERTRSYRKKKCDVTVTPPEAEQNTDTEADSSYSTPARENKPPNEFAKLSEEIQNLMAGRILNTQRVHAWLEQGADPELILETLRVKMTGRSPPGSLNYFDGAIADAIKSRTQPLPKGKANGSTFKTNRENSRPSRKQELDEGLRIALAENQKIYGINTGGTS